MTDVNHIYTPTTFVQESKDRILSQFGKSTNLQNVIEIESERWKLLDEAVVGLATGKLIDNATGSVLDEIGVRLGVSRFDATDDEYRVAIKVRAYSRNNTGTRADIVDSLSRFTGTDSTFIDIYQGNEKRLDLIFFEGCFDRDTGTVEVIKLLPLVTNYSILIKFRPSVLGLTVVDVLGTETNPGNFGTLSAGEIPIGDEGSLPALVNTYSTGVI